MMGPYAFYLPKIFVTNIDRKILFWNKNITASLWWIYRKDIQYIDWTSDLNIVTKKLCLCFVFLFVYLMCISINIYHSKQKSKAKFDTWLFTFYALYKLINLDVLKTFDKYIRKYFILFLYLSFFLCYSSCVTFSWTSFPFVFSLFPFITMYSYLNLSFLRPVWREAELDCILGFQGQ